MVGFVSGQPGLEQDIRITVVSWIVVSALVFAITGAFGISIGLGRFSGTKPRLRTYVAFLIIIDTYFDFSCRQRH